jgi:hypothetical protein
MGSPRSECEAQDTCAFDARCSNYINCQEHKPVDTDGRAELMMRVKALEADVQHLTGRVRRAEELAEAALRQIADLKAKYGRQQSGERG